MNLEELKKEIPFKWRVQSSNQYGASCVAYIDARDVQDVLDEVCGADKWQCKYSEHKGNLFCSIAILDKHGSWVWKEDCRPTCGFALNAVRCAPRFRARPRTGRTGRSSQACPDTASRPR